MLNFLAIHYPPIDLSATHIQSKFLSESTKRHSSIVCHSIVHVHEARKRHSSNQKVERSIRMYFHTDPCHAYRVNYFDCEAGAHKVCAAISNQFSILWKWNSHQRIGNLWNVFPCERARRGVAMPFSVGPDGSSHYVRIVLKSFETRNSYSHKRNMPLIDSWMRIFSASLETISICRS